MSTPFPFSEDVRKILLDAINRLVNLREATPRIRLRQKLSGRRDVLERLIAEYYLIPREKDNYVPGIMTFETCGDDSLLNFAKTAAGVVLRTLKNLYEVNAYLNGGPKTSFNRLEIGLHARRLYEVVEEEKIPLGMSLISELGIDMLAGWEPSSGVITVVHVREDILDFQDVEEFWRRVVQQRLAVPVQRQLPEKAEVVPVGSGTRAADLSFMHDRRLRAIAERDYAELDALDPRGESKSTLILAGGIIEGLLLDALVASSKWTFEQGCEKNLQDMIAPAKTAGIISEDRLSDAIRKYRALVHPGREIRDKVTPTEADAGLAKAAVKVIIQEVRRWYSGRLPQAGTVTTPATHP
jgi:hypothetical protein